MEYIWPINIFFLFFWFKNWFLFIEKLTSYQLYRFFFFYFICIWAISIYFPKNFHFFSKWLIELMKIITSKEKKIKLSVKRERKRENQNKNYSFFSAKLKKISIEFIQKIYWYDDDVFLVHFIVQFDLRILNAKKKEWIEFFESKIKSNVIAIVFYVCFLRNNNKLWSKYEPTNSTQMFECHMVRFFFIGLWFFFLVDGGW